jgi:hypothetical protein
VEKQANRFDPGVLKVGALRFANPVAGGMSSGSKLIVNATTELNWAERSYDYRIRGFGEVLGEMKKLVPDSERAMALKEGTVLPKTVEEQKFLDMANGITQDFARRAKDQGFLKEGQEIANYAPHNTDMGALWGTFREQFNEMQGWSDLPAAMKAKLSKDEYREFKDVFFKHPDWETVPKDTMRRVKDKLWDFSDVSSSWDNLPSFIKNQLPQELFVKYFLPRSGRVPYEKDFYKVMQSYIGRVEGSLNFSPWLEKWQPTIQSLPGGMENGGLLGAFTERGFLEKLANNAILRRPTWDENTLRTLFDRTNLIIGRDLLKVQDAEALSQMARNGFMRGAIGVAPDSALANLTQGLYTWADSGRLMGPMGKYLMGRSAKPPTGLISEMLDVFGHDVSSQRPMMQKVLAFDRKFTEWALAPMGLAERVNRGVAFHAGLEEALAKGFNHTEALQTGFARASSVVPNLALTEAEMKAFESVMRTQMGYTPATRAPLFAGKGPLTRMTTMLASFPAHTAQFLQTGIRSGFADMMLRNEPAKFVRYMALTGSLFGAVGAARYMGADISNMFGAQSLLGGVGIPMVKGIMSGYNAVQGKDPWAMETAQKEWLKFIGTMTLPGFRYGSKVLDITGYPGNEGTWSRGYQVDKRGRFLYETTPYGELMRLTGINPEKAYDTKQLARTYLELSHQYAFDKQKAVEAMLNGDPSLAQSFTMQWGHSLKPSDIQNALKQRMTTPESRGLSRVPMNVRPQMMQQAGQ